MDRRQPQNDEIQMLTSDVRQFADALAQALQSCGMRANEQASWAALIPHMRLDQLARLAEIVAASTADSAAQEARELLPHARVIEERCVAAQAETDHDFSSGMSSLVQEMRAHERAAQHNKL